MLRVCETFSVNRYIYNPVEYKGTVKVNGEVKDVAEKFISEMILILIILMRLQD